jgi:hypothetical protein
MKLGKRAPRHDPRTLRLSRYLTPALTPPPIRAGYVEKVPTWPMYLNDRLGDCVIAAAGHMIQDWTTYAGKEVTITDKDVLIGYEHVGGYVPGDPSTDNGCVILDALKYWRSTGFGKHKIAAYMAVDFNNHQQVQQAIQLFGSVYIGLWLPLSAQSPRSGFNTKPVWEVPHAGPVGDGSPGGWGGHAVPLIGYSADPKGAPGTMVVTWGNLFDMTWNFLDAYCDEMWVCLTADWFDNAGKSPTGLNLAQLQADLQAL